MTIAEPLLVLMLAYIGVGLAFAVHFVTRLAPRIDESAIGAPLGFKVLIFPGVVALWPVLAFKAARAKDRE